jgi:hypothetical protein
MLKLETRSLHSGNSMLFDIAFIPKKKLMLYSMLTKHAIPFLPHGHMFCRLYSALNKDNNVRQDARNEIHTPLVEVNQAVKAWSY